MQSPNHGLETQVCADGEEEGMGGGGNTRHRSKSMQQEKAERLAHVRALHQARAQVGMLGSLIRLADYMMVGDIMSLKFNLKP